MDSIDKIWETSAHSLVNQVSDALLLHQYFHLKNFYLMLLMCGESFVQEYFQVLCILNVWKRLTQFLVCEIQFSYMLTIYSLIFNAFSLNSQLISKLLYDILLSKFSYNHFSKFRNICLCLCRILQRLKYNFFSLFMIWHCVCYKSKNFNKKTKVNSFFNDFLM